MTEPPNMRMKRTVAFGARSLSAAREVAGRLLSHHDGHRTLETSGTGTSPSQIKSQDQADVRAISAS